MNVLNCSFTASTKPDRTGPDRTMDRTMDRITDKRKRIQKNQIIYKTKQKTKRENLNMLNENMKCALQASLSCSHS